MLIAGEGVIFYTLGSYTRALSSFITVCTIKGEYIPTQECVVILHFKGSGKAWRIRKHFKRGLKTCHSDQTIIKRPEKFHEGGRFCDIYVKSCFCIASKQSKI